MNILNSFQKINLIAIFILIFIQSCNNSPSNNTDETYLNFINDWDSKRVERLKSKTGWLNLVGLFWLEEGENKFGSDKSNDVVFPEGKADKFLGSFTLEDGVVKVKINTGSEVLNENKKINGIVMLPDTASETTILDHKSLSWFVIIRGERVGIRLRDHDSELVKNFKGIERFPVDTTWKVKARLIPHNSPKKIIVPNIVGTFNEEENPGKIVFERNGQEFSIEPIVSGDQYFLIFADETSGIETYGAGRFLYSPVADENGNLIIDFNKAYNPPCAFTKFATCPLPPKENHLKLAITAGEKNWGSNH